MRSSTLERKLVTAVLVLFLVPTLVVGAVLVVLYRHGTFGGEPTTLALALAIGLAALMAYLATVAHALGRPLVRTLREIQLGAELIATVNPGHRLEVRTGDELQALAEEINRMADRVAAARRELEREVARATRALAAERTTLAAVLESLGEGAILATPDGRVTLANRAAQTLLGSGLLGRSLFEAVDREKVGLFLERLRSGASPAERFSLPVAGGGVLGTVMTPLLDGERRMTGIILVLRDVTGPTRLDEDRRALLADTLRALRDPLASIRSLSESLLPDPALAEGPASRLLRAIHEEALRLSQVVRRLDESGSLGVAHAPAHFEAITVTDLTAMTLRRLAQDGGGGEGVEVGATEGAAPPIRAEAAALSGALAYLAAAVRARRAPASAARLGAAQRGRVVEIDAAATGQAAAADLEALLDVPAPTAATGRLSVREVVRRHAGEVWAYAGDGRFGYRITLPLAEPGPAPPADDDPAAGRGSGFAGAGLASGFAEAEAGDERPDFYDFSLFEQMARDLAPADRDRPLAELTCVVFDTETTGLAPDDGDRIVSIAGVRVRGGAVRRGETFDAIVNPGRPIPATSVRFHGITDAMAAGAPPMEAVLPAFLRFAEGTVLVGHQVGFDLRFLAREAARLERPSLTATHAVLDTLLLSEVVHGPLEGHGLDTVARRLGVAVRGRHSALGDALVTAEVFVRLVALLERRGVRTLGDAMEAARRVRGVGPGPASGPGAPGGAGP